MYNDTEIILCPRCGIGDMKILKGTVVDDTFMCGRCVEEDLKVRDKASYQIVRRNQ